MSVIPPNTETQLLQTLLRKARTLAALQGYTDTAHLADVALAVLDKELKEQSTPETAQD